MLIVRHLIGSCVPHDASCKAPVIFGAKTARVAAAL